MRSEWLANEKGKSVLILVHRRELVTQASNKLAKAGVKHGIIAAGFDPSDHPVQVASVQTLIRRLNSADFTPDLIIIDEAHHAVAGSWDKIIGRFPNAKIIGVTATPSRLDGRGLEAISQPRLRAIRRTAHKAWLLVTTRSSRRPLLQI